MRRIYVLLGIVAMVPMFLMLTAYNGEVSRANDGNWENSGSPGDGADCSACHSGNLSTDNSWISTNIPIGGYVAGQTYTIAITSTGGGSTSRKGFSATCENSANDYVGTFVITDATNTVFFQEHVSHTATGNGLTSWSFDWTAPATGSGEVTFYSSTVFDGYGGGIVNSSESFVEATTGIPSLVFENELSVYPNPAIDQLNMKISSMKNELVQISIYSITGQHILNKSVLVSGNSINQIFDVSEFESGMYIIQLKGTQGVYSKRFIVQ
jgi:hypothetical protein